MQFIVSLRKVGLTNRLGGVFVNLMMRVMMVENSDCIIVPGDEKELIHQVTWVIGATTNTDDVVAVLESIYASLRLV